LTEWIDRSDERSQQILFATSLDEAIPPDHPLRLFVEIIGRLDLGSLTHGYSPGLGRPGIHPRVMVSVLLWGLLSGVRSSRKLEEALQYRLDFRWLTYAVRFGLAVVLYLAVSVASSIPWRSAAGLTLFHAQLLITAFYLTITAIFGFSQAIAEEKEDGTLGLMRLADISPLSIILGKLSGRLADAGLLLLLQFPFTIVAITLGGVSWAHVTAAYSALAAYLWLLATLGIAASVFQPTGAAAARWTAGLISLYVLPPYGAMANVTGFGKLLGACHFISLPMRLSAVTESSFNEPAWCAPVACGLVGGVICLLVAWLAFDRIAIEPQTARPCFRPALHARLPSRVIRRAWSHPVIWREFVFLTGGIQWLLLRVLVHSAVLLATVGVMGGMPFMVVHAYWAWASIASGLYALMDGTWLASRMFHDEIRDRTWSSLVQTPHSIRRLAFEKFCGWTLGLIPSIVIPYMFLVTSVALYPAELSQRVEVLMGSITVGLAVFAYLHLLVLMSLHYGWQATPLTLTISFAAGWLYVMTIFNTPGLQTHSIFAATCVILALVMAALQFLIVRRLGVLAETA